MAFDPALVELKWDNKSENDEGDYDSYTTSILLYDGQEIWRHSTASHSNIGGAWGNEHKVVLAEDRRSCVCTESDVGGTVGTGGRSSTAKKPETINIEELVSQLKK